MFYRLFALVIAFVLTASCAQVNTTVLASDYFLGRNNQSPQSLEVQDYLIALLADAGATGLNGPGDEPFKQNFANGTNIIAIIPGTDLAHEYVMVGAHYDHLAFCPQATAGDTICNGATDNAAGVAAVLDIGLHMKPAGNRPRRSVILAFWDAEEDGLLGSQHYVANPIIPLADTVAYINFDILGSNILPSLRGTSIAVGAESGGPALIAGVDSAIATQSLDVVQFSEIFGQGRSDHANLIQGGVPTVFFTDSTGPCYHTTGDDLSVVNFDKLNQQIRIATDLADQLASGSLTPTFDAGAALATFDDAVALNSLIQQSLPDIGRFNAGDQANIQAWALVMETMVADGPGLFDDGDLNSMLGIALQLVSILASGECDGFLEDQT